MKEGIIKVLTFPEIHRDRVEGAFPSSYLQWTHLYDLSDVSVC